MIKHARYLSVLLTALVGCGGGSTTVSTGAGTAQITSGGTTVTAQQPMQQPMQSLPPSPPPPPQQMAHFRVIHASPDMNVNNVALYFDGQPTAAIPSLQYRAARGYIDVPASAHQIAVRPAAAPATAPAAFQESTPPLAPNQYYTVIAHGLVGGTPGLAVAASVDDNTQPDTGHARVRFFHAQVGAGAVDVCMPGASANAPAQPVFRGVRYGTWGTAAGTQSPYAQIPSGRPVRLQVRAENPRACTGRLLGHVNVTAPDRAVATAIAVGNPSGNPPIQPEVLVCVDAPLAGESSCIPVAITPR